jgi:hypothetical protein
MCKNSSGKKLKEEEERTNKEGVLNLSKDHLYKSKELHAKYFHGVVTYQGGTKVIFTLCPMDKACP